MKESAAAADRARGRIALDLFGGAGRVANRWAAKGYGALTIDLWNGDGYDLLDAAIQNAVLGYIRARRVTAVCAAPPCGSWSRARRGPADGSGPPPPIRSTSRPLGLPDILLRPADAQKVREGNAVMRFLVKLVDACLSAGTPLIIENPRSSILWHAGPLRRALAHWRVGFVDCDQCQYGAAWMKATRLAAVGVPPTCMDKLSLRCQGRRICSATGCPHFRLSGLDEDGKRFRTSHAQTYPHRFATTIADALASAFEQRSLLRLHQACG